MAIFPTGSGVFLKKESQRFGRRFVGPVSPGQPGPAPSMTPRWRRKRPIPPCALFWFTNAMQMWYTLMGHSYSLPAASVFPRLWAAPPTTTTMTTLGHYNPLRYRGYVYDAETGFYYLNSRYYNPTWGRFINADGFVSTGQGISGDNMFAYCGNNPVNRYDPSGNAFLGIMAGAALLKLFIAGAASCLVYIGFKSIINNPPASPPITIPKFEFKSKTAERAKEKEKPAAIPSQSNTTIYRYGGTNPGNLTPREKDKYTGLSFSTIPLPGAAKTTIEALNSTGIVYAVRDSETHVSVRPVGGTMQDWIDAGSASIWTQAVKSVVIKWDGTN